MNLESAVKQTLEYIEESTNIVALTGAGISTLSGIPDFRSDRTGIWEKYDQNLVFSLSKFYNEPTYFYEFAFDYIYNFIDKEPSIVHQVLARMEQKQKLNWIITQNIDMLHQKSGSKKVLELHGSPTRHYCIDCSKNQDVDETISMIKKREIPKCKFCSGIIKPDIIFYEEQLKEDVLRTSQQAMLEADLMFILGSSMVVYPAAMLPQLFQQSGGNLIIINKQPTQYDAYASLKFDDLKSFFSALDKLL